MPGGRPTLYTEELLAAADTYVDTYEDYEHAFPSDIGLCDVIGISKSTLYLWAQDPDKKPFLDILDRIDRKQQLVAWNKGLKNEYNANLVKLLLGKHGFHDKADNTLAGPNGGPVETKTIFEFTAVGSGHGQADQD